MGQKIADIGILSIEAIAVVVRIMLDAVWQSVAEDSRSDGVAYV
jgi:hypothetical protein